MQPSEYDALTVVRFMNVWALYDGYQEAEKKAQKEQERLNQRMRRGRKGR